MIDQNNEDIIKNMKNKIEDIGNQLDKFHNMNFDSCICEEAFNLRNSLKEYEEVEEKYNEEFYFNCCCCDWCPCYPCYCCCLNGKSKNDEKIKKEIKIINKLKKEKIDNKLEFIETHNKSESNGLHTWMKFLFFLFSFIHFYAISEIYSVQFALFRELKRSLIRSFKEKYEINDQKIFEVYYRESIKRDVSQINISYISSFFTCYLVKKYGKLLVYLLSIVIIFLFMIFVSFVKFLPEEKIYKGKNYDGYVIFLIGFFYLFINIFTGIICFMPILLLNKNNSNNNNVENRQNQKKEKDWLNNIIIILAITLSVIIKILIHTKIDISLRFSCFIFLFCSIIYLSFLFFHNKCLSHYDNKKIDNSDIEDLDNVNIINDSFMDIQKENKEKEREKYTLSYYLGCFIIEFEKLFISIKIKGFCSYIGSFFTKKTLLMLLSINFFSRAQKIRFKLDFRKTLENKDEDEHPEYNIIIIFIMNFIFSFFIFLFEIFENKCEENNIDNNNIKNEKNNNNENNYFNIENNNNFEINNNSNENNYSSIKNNNKHVNNKNNEKNIIIYIIIANIIIYISSILHLSKKIREKYGSIICYFSIAITGLGVLIMFFISTITRRKNYIFLYLHFFLFLLYY